MLAQKQPPFKECVIAHWSRGSAPKMYRGSSLPPKLWMSKDMVGEHCSGVEVLPKGKVELLQERMPVLVNEKTSENLVRRKPKVSWGRVVRPG
jgi:hypothetical protein